LLVFEPPAGPAVQQVGSHAGRLVHREPVVVAAPGGSMSAPAVSLEMALIRYHLP